MNDLGELLRGNSAVLGSGVSVVVSIVALVVFYHLVGILVRKVRDHADWTPPSGITEASWRQTIESGDKTGVKLYSALEILTFYLAFRIGQPVLVGGWLAFKVASKWEVWQSIVKVPSEFSECADSLENLRVRNRWASVVLQAHLVGTLGNVLGGFFAALLGACVDNWI